MSREVPRAVRWLVLSLLFAYPAQYRQRFALDLLDVVRDTRRRERTSLAVTSMRLVVDLLLNLPLVWLDEYRSSRSYELAPRKRRKGSLMPDLLTELRWASRTLRRSPALTVAVILTVGLGIGANTALFSVVDAVLLRPLPFKEPARLVLLWQKDRLRGTSQESFSAPDFFDVRERTTVYDDLAALGYVSYVATGAEQEPERLSALAVSANLLSMVGASTAAGRDFAARDDVKGAEKVVLLSQALFERRFGGDDSVIGELLQLDGVGHRIVGVLGPDQGFPTAETPLYVPLHTSPLEAQLPYRGAHSFTVLGRLEEGMSVEAANQELVALMEQLETEYPDDNLGRSGWVEPLSEAIVGPVRPALLALLGAVALVLLIACVNTANLLLSRATTREREVAVRGALGAGKLQLIRQSLIESLLLSSAGGLLGVLMAHFGLPLLLALGGDSLPRAEQVGVDLRALLFTAFASLGAGLLFGVVPALRGSSPKSLHGLRDGGRSGRSGGALRHSLATVELALAVVLVIGAGLLLRSLVRLEQVPLGFEPEGLFEQSLQLPTAQYPQDRANFPDWPQVRQFHQGLLERVRAVPGVTLAALAHQHPLSPGWTTRFAIAGRPQVDPGEQDEIRIRPVSSDYFRTAGIPLVRGRALVEADREGSSAVVVINEAVVRRYFADEEPLGQHIELWGMSREIVGVVGDVRFRGLTRETPIALYAPLSQLPFADFSLVVRSSGELSSLEKSVQSAVWDLDAELPRAELVPFDDLVARSLARPRFNTRLLGTFAFSALLLAVMGIYGVIAYGVAQRTREIGLRIALGAHRRDLLAWILGQGLRMALIGIVLGIVGALALSRTLESLLFGIPGTDAVTFLAVTALFLVVALISAWLPARRASRVDPVVALRHDSG